MSTCLNIQPAIPEIIHGCRDCIRLDFKICIWKNVLYICIRNLLCLFSMHKFIMIWSWWTFYGKNLSMSCINFFSFFAIIRPITCFCYVLMISWESQKISWKCQIFLLSDEILEITSNDIMRNFDVFIRFSNFLIISSEHNKSRWSI